MDSEKNRIKPSKLQVETTPGATDRYTKASYFQEKDKKATEFLKKHPVPANLLK
jgi:hypothetical protein